jgi:hypothetical protein
LQSDFTQQRERARRQCAGLALWQASHYLTEADVQKCFRLGHWPGSLSGQDRKFMPQSMAGFGAVSPTTETARKPVRASPEAPIRA